ncbi:hypothetical protein B0H66DRAFT_531473 [Apodospora peruviana]|uniref:Uncharacterized protein n=1 Tax=Apodospora peruviana TaxID=516989 RepID=A0AAE0ICD1_9PEZI|nr:hypothetical protein B0H66DRAFT_531473 [Apodospora peruviana]
MMKGMNILYHDERLIKWTACGEISTSVSEVAWVRLKDAISGQPTRSKHETEQARCGEEVSSRFTFLSGWGPAITIIRSRPPFPVSVLSRPIRGTPQHFLDPAHMACHYTALSKRDRLHDSRTGSARVAISPYGTLASIDDKSSQNARIQFWTRGNAWSRDQVSQKDEKRPRFPSTRAQPVELWVWELGRGSRLTRQWRVEDSGGKANGSRNVDVQAHQMFVDGK